MIRTRTRRRSALLAFAMFLGSVCPTVDAQNPKKSSTPRVGRIKDYPATGLMVGCGNLYFHHRGRPHVTATDYVFLSRGDGSNAWMNLNGRDVRLRQVKRGASAKQKDRPFYYRYGDWQITVEIESLADKAAPAEADPMLRMKITLRKGRTVRVVWAEGDSDC